MNIKLKKLFSLILMGGMLISSFSVVFANEVNNEELPEPVEMILVENGMPRVITPDELEKLYPVDRDLEYSMPIKNATKSELYTNEDESITPMAITFLRYVEIEGEDIINEDISKPVTPWVNGSEDGASISFGQSLTHNSDFGISISTEINAILTTIGMSYVRSASNSESFGATFTIGANKEARVRFAPTTRESTGTMQTWRQLEGELEPRLISEKPSSSIVVKKVGDFADGLYYLEYR